MWVVFLKLVAIHADLWLRKERETGDYQASLPVGRGTQPKIKELEEFREFIQEHKDLTQKQMAELWGDDATQHAYKLCLSKTGYHSPEENLWLLGARWREKRKINQKTRI